MAVDITTDPTFATGKPHTLFDGPYLSTGPNRSYDVTPDGQRFLMVQQAENRLSEAPISQANVVLNWFEELKRLAPAGN